eukprot:m.87603 g.87603  ORF g.87603 m.87603 type:complete len:391 (-) comp26092_c0_seq1:169-1341(-)
MSTTTQTDTKRPKNSKFRQQNLPAWKPILTPATVLPTFFGFGVVFSIIGAVLLAENGRVKEVEIDYTDCMSVQDPLQSCGAVLDTDSAFTNTSQLWNRCECKVSTTLSGFSGKDVFIYYAFENFYQNHRRYVESRSDDQLRSVEAGASEDCDPLASEDGKYFAPCGLIANSLFNDTIQLRTNNQLVTVVGNDISWESDRKVKFINPENNGTTASLCESPTFSPEKSLKPLNWPVDACKLGETIADCTGPSWCSSESVEADDCSYNPWSSCYASSGLGYENEDLIVWMRTAALPTFRKLYRRVPDGLEDGVYDFEIGFNFPVKSFDGKKKIFVSTTSIIGGKSNFLPGCYLAVGLLCLLAGISFLILQYVKPPTRQVLGSVSNLAWEDQSN